MWTETLSAENPRALLRAVELLREGEVVALPTETVYGLAADALNPLAVAKIFEAKERPAFDPLICHLPDLDWLPRLTRVTEDASSELVVALIRRFWPGPLTLVLPKSARVPDIVTSGLPHVALRMSANPAFQEIARKFNRPLAAPSANRFGRISPTTAEHVVAELEHRIQLVIDGGPTNHGLESTIVAIRQNALHILRSGPVTREALAEFAPIAESAAPAKPEAPGQLESHYAPRTRMQLLSAAKPRRTPFARDACRHSGVAVSAAGRLRRARSAQCHRRPTGSRRHALLENAPPRRSRPRSYSRRAGARDRPGRRNHGSPAESVRTALRACAAKFCAKRSKKHV